MIEKIEIKKLFGRFNYVLDLKSKDISIITAPNGFGKSTILKILFEFYNNDFAELLNHEFESVTFTVNNNVLNIAKQRDCFSVNDVYLPYVNKQIKVTRRSVPIYLRRLDENRYLNTRTNEIVIIEDLVGMTGENMDSISGERRNEIGGTAVSVACRGTQARFPGVDTVRSIDRGMG